MSAKREVPTCVLHRDFVVLFGKVDAVACPDGLLFDGHDVWLASIECNEVDIRSSCLSVECSTAAQMIKSRYDREQRQHR